MRNLSYAEEQLEHARRANDEGKEVPVLREREDLDSTPVGRDKTILHGMRCMPLVQRERDNKKGGGAQVEYSAAEVHIEALVENETERIIEEHGLFNSDHEAWAVIQEEIEEAQEDMDIVYRRHRFWWEMIREDRTEILDIVDDIEKYAIEVIKEAVQVIACCRKYKRGHLKQWVEKQVKRVGGEHDAD